MAKPVMDTKDEVATGEGAVEASAIAASYNQQIRPLLDAVDRLRHLKVTQEGIQLPTIVVVGDQSSGKSSVLESLAGISLPRGQGICTRVPLVMQLQDDPSAAAPQLRLEYRDKVVTTTEAGVGAAINDATADIAGCGKGISDTPITLVVRKKGVPDLTLVDLPGITRVPVHGQPDDIYDQIASIIKKYIVPAESIILNVLSAAVDFTTCESIRMSQQVDRMGERTLAVVTKGDKHPEGLLEKVTVDDVQIGLGYVCVRNRVGDETYEQARTEEERLFKWDPLLSSIDKTMVGIPVLAQRLMEIQQSIITKCLPDIVKRINDRLRRTSAELDGMPTTLTSYADAIRALMHVLKLVRDSLDKILIRGEFDEFPDDLRLHGTARIAEMVQSYSSRLPTQCPTRCDEPFLMEEVRVLQEMKGLHLPNFLPRSAFLTMHKKKVEAVMHMPLELVTEFWVYVEDVVIQILMLHTENYPQLQSSCRRAVQSLVEKKLARSAQYVKETIQMELIGDYTSNPDYMKAWTDIMEGHRAFVEAVENHWNPAKLTLRGLGEVEVAHLRPHAEVNEQAFDLRARLMAYWRIVVLRLVDGLALHILLAIRRLVEKELEAGLVDELVGDKMAGVDRMLEESPATAAKRDRLRRSIDLLRQSKAVVANIVDRISTTGDYN